MLTFLLGYLMVVILSLALLSMTTASDMSESDFGTCETALVQLLYEDSYGLEDINDIRKKTPSQMFERLLNRPVMVIVYLH